MICPNDSTQMHQVKICAHYGQPIILEQCSQCGGIWFDESELFMAKQGEAEKIESLNTEALRTPLELKETALKCPKDNKELFQFKDRYFPKGIILERCPSCGGIWLNRGDFSRFQQARREFTGAKVKTADDISFKEDIKRILEEYQTGGTTGTLKNLGEFLSTPIDRNTLLPLDNDDERPEANNMANFVLNALMLVFRALMLR
jgi:Zn-finger nucleic acid-binding protein